MVNRGRVGGSGSSPMWHVWLVVFVIAVSGAIGLSAAWHAAHDADSNCVVCELIDESLAELAGDFQVGPGKAPEPATPLSVTAWVPAHQDEQVPTRAPPLS